MKNNLLVVLSLAIISSCHSQIAEVPVAVIDTSNQEYIAPPPLSPAQLKKYHDAVAAVVEKNLLRGSFNGAILVAKNGNIVYEKYVGTANPRQRKKDSLTDQTSFQIASTGKTLTSAAVLKLIQEGKIRLNDSVTKYFPALPYPGITVKDLLDHRSGLPNYINYMEKSPWNRKQQATNTDVLNTLITWKPARTANPNKRFHYCNTNFVLLALIVEKVSGMSFPEYMKQNIFIPLGMNNTFVIGPNEQQGVMQSFRANGIPWNLDYSDGPYGDKNIYSTPRDLLKWDQALYSGKLLNENILNEAFTPYSNEKPGIRNYGLGWRMLLFPGGKKIIYHNGHWHGFHSSFVRLPDEKGTIILLTNNHHISVYNTAKKLYEVFGNYDGKPENGEE